MNRTLVTIVPLALAAAVNPTGVCFLMAILARSRRTALAVATGFTLVFVAIGVVVLGLGLRVSSGGHSEVSAIIDLVAAVLVTALGVRSLKKRRPESADKQPDAHRRKLGLAAGFVVGLGLAVTDFTSIVPYGVALKEIARSGLAAAEQAVLVAVFLLIAMAPMWLPPILALAFPRAADRVLQPLERTLTRHGNAIVGVVCLVLAAYLAVKGVRAL